MSAAAMLEELAALGVKLRADGENLRLQAPPGVLTAELRERIAELKPLLLAALDPEAIRDHLLGLAIAHGVARRIPLALRDGDLLACVGLPDSVLCGFLRGLQRDEGMAKGRAPPGWETAVECPGCGPVWLPAGSPARFVACPWCWHRKAGTRLPRPPVACSGCRHFIPAPDNPQGGIGRCALTGKPSAFPDELHECGNRRGG